MGLLNTLQMDIGCVVDPTGAGYNGTASRGESGQRCLDWNTTGLEEIFPGQSSWRHNHCRNPEGDMEFPICFIPGGDYDICVVPDCEELEVRRREVDRIPEMCRRHRATGDG